MAQSFPYTFISCPCSDVSRQVPSSKRASRDIELEDQLQEEEKTFDSRNPRSNFSLFPPEYLLYCEECHDIKCQRCVTEEIICSYCPSCLFEVPSSSVKADYNRCARNCFSCPVCMSQLITASLGDKNEGPWILNCNYCMWSSLDVGIKFSKPQSLRQQIDRMANGGRPQPDYRDASKGDVRTVLGKDFERSGKPKSTSYSMTSSETNEKLMDNANSEPSTNPHTRFHALKSFYKDQIASSSGDVVGSSTMLDYSSPSSLSRLMSLYANTGSSTYKKKQASTPMREALNTSEGLLTGASSEITSPEPLEYAETTTLQQRDFQLPHPVGNPNATSVSSLRPMPTILRTKRAKRCAACKHILVKPEFKVTSTRYRIKLVALNYIPLISLKPVPVAGPGGLRAPGPDGADIVLEPGKPSQWIMTLRNPLFENVNVSLGSPSVTPGKHGHKVTILCPEFTIGKNGDVWDDALNTGNNLTNKTNMAGSVTGSNNGTTTAGEQIAGKVYESGRNWTSIVIEVIPANIPPTKQTKTSSSSSVSTEPSEDRDEDEDVIEIPIRVRLEWTVSDDESEGIVTRRRRRQQQPSQQKRTKSEKLLDEEEEDADLNDDGADDDGVDAGKRELAYWMVIGIGRVAC